MTKRVYPAFGHLHIDKITSRQIQQFIPVIEYNDNGVWKRLNYSPESYKIPEQWALCAILDDTERQFSTVMSIFGDRLEGSWNPGEYRAVVFAGKETIYAPFAIIEN